MSRLIPDGKAPITQLLPIVSFSGATKAATTGVRLPPSANYRLAPLALSVDQHRDHILTKTINLSHLSRVAVEIAVPMHCTTDGSHANPLVRTTKRMRDRGPVAGLLSHPN